MQGNVQRLVQTLYSVGRQAAAPLKSGRRRNSKLTQFIITDETDDCDIARSLPGQKKQRSRRKHSLSFNAANNTAPLLT